MDDGFTIDYSKFDQALGRALAQSRRDPIVFMKEQAKGVVKRIVSITPPASQGAMGGDAKKQGVTKVRADIRKVYGSPAAAYQLIKDKEQFTGQAKSFWGLTKNGEQERAKDLFRAATGESYGPFDGGSLHHAKRVNGRVRGGRRDQPFMYVWDGEDMKNYIKEKENLVGWLAAGWNFAAALLGARPAAWIWRHASPGSGQIVVNDQGVKIIMTNRVDYASAIKDMTRRVQWALNTQADAMNRRAEQYLKTLFKDQGFKLAA